MTGHVRSAGTDEKSPKTRIKLCGLTRPCDIGAANGLMPDFIGFVFFKKSRRYISPEAAAGLKKLLNPAIQAVGVFVNESPETAAGLLKSGVIDMAQLHGSEDSSYIRRLRGLTDKPIIQAFSAGGPEAIEAAEESAADLVLLDSGAGGTGTAFDWELLRQMRRPYFLAGGLTPENAGQAVTLLRPWAVDVSSGIETGGVKDPQKMKAFMEAVRRA